jgi:hypothetical protein
MKIAAATLILVLGFGTSWWIRLDADSHMRQRTVEDWNMQAGEHGELYFTATGWQSRTLVIHGDPNKFNGPLGVALTDAVVHSDLDAKIKALGFREIELNGVKKALK